MRRMSVDRSVSKVEDMFVVVTRYLQEQQVTTLLEQRRRRVLNNSAQVFPAYRNSGHVSNTYTVKKVLGCNLN